MAHVVTTIGGKTLRAEWEREHRALSIAFFVDLPMGPPSRMG